MPRPRRRKHPGTLQERGGSFRLHLCVGGARHLFTIPTTDRATAEAFAREKYDELARLHARRRLGLSADITCAVLFDRFEEQELPPLARGTRDAYRDSLKSIRAYFVNELGDPLIGTIRAEHVKGFLAWRRVHRLDGGAALSNRTLVKDRAVLHRIFEIAEQLEYRDGNPVARVVAPKADGRDPVILTADEYERLIAECEYRPMVQLYVLVLGEAGLRCESEALRLEWGDVDLEKAYLWIASGRDGHRTKSGKGRWVPMTERLERAMREHFAACRFAAYDGTRPAAVFHHETTARQHRAGDRIKSLRDAFRSAATRAKLSPALHQHDLRHRRVTTWLAEGKSAAIVQEAMGHSDLRTTMGYKHLSREHLRQLVSGDDSQLPDSKKGEASA
jgi:integrase